MWRSTHTEEQGPADPAYLRYLAPYVALATSGKQPKRGPEKPIEVASVGPSPLGAHRSERPIGVLEVFQNRHQPECGVRKATQLVVSLVTHAQRGGPVTAGVEHVDDHARQVRDLVMGLHVREHDHPA